MTIYEWKGLLDHSNLLQVSGITDTILKGWYKDLGQRTGAYIFQTSNGYYATYHGYIGITVIQEQVASPSWLSYKLTREMFDKLKRTYFISEVYLPKNYEGKEHDFSGDKR